MIIDVVFCVFSRKLAGFALIVIAVILCHRKSVTLCICAKYQKMIKEEEEINLLW